MQKNIVILGAGFGGIRCALELDRAFARDSSLRFRSAQNDDWKVVLVDRNAYQVYSPRLYDTAIPDDLRGGAEMEKSRIDILSVLKNTAIEFVQGEVNGVDCKSRQVVISRPKKAEKSHTVQVASTRHAEGEGFLADARNDDSFLLEYDYLVFALGAGTDYFGIPGLQENACTLKSLEDAEVIRERVEGFLGFHNSPQPSLNLREGDRFSIMIGGAGATGVEVAAELAYLFRQVPREQWSITLVEALPRILSMFPNALSQYAHQRLEALGVHFMLDTCIKEVVPTARHPEVSAEGSRAIKNNGILRAAQNDSVKVGVVLAPRPLKPGEAESDLICDFLPEHEKRISADLLLWAGGVRANPLLTACGMPVDRKGRLEVDEHLQVKGMDQVFAIGDNATLLDPATNQTIPATAQAALEQGRLVADNIGRLVKTGGLASYKFHDFSAIVPLADRDGVALIGKRVVRGFPAWVLRKAADYRYYATIVGWWKAVKRCIL